MDNKISLRSVIRILADLVEEYEAISVQSSEYDPTMIFFDITKGPNTGTGFYDLISKELYTVTDSWNNAIRERKREAIGEENVTKVC